MEGVTTTKKSKDEVLQEVEAKAAKLSEINKVKVFPIVFLVKGSEDYVIGYIKEPPRNVKLRVMDQGLTSPITAASVIVDAYLIKEDSDAKIYSEDAENDKFYIGAVMAAYDLIVVAVNQLKKN